MSDVLVPVSETCRMCKNTFKFRVSEIGLMNWKNGGLIQRELPNLSADERELLMTQICGMCFDKMFAGDDDE